MQNDAIRLHTCPGGKSVDFNFGVFRGSAVILKKAAPPPLGLRLPAGCLSVSDSDFVYIILRVAILFFKKNVLNTDTAGPRPARSTHPPLAARKMIPT